MLPTLREKVEEMAVEEGSSGVNKGMGGGGGSHTGSRQSDGQQEEAAASERGEIPTVIGHVLSVVAA